MSNNTVYLPWSWSITSTDVNTHTCPSVSGILTTFAIVNAAVTFLSVIFGNRHVVEFMSCGCLGKVTSKSWTYTWIISLGLNLTANAIIAGIIKNSQGYYSDFKVWELMLFLLARPRLSWIIMGFFAGKAKKLVSIPVDQKKLIKKRPSGYYQVPGDGPSYVEEMTYHPLHGSTTTLVQRQYDRPWMNAFLSNFIAEVLMQLAALYVMGRTTRFAWVNGFYNIFNPTKYHSLPPGAHMMYAGALYYLIGGSLSLLIAIFAIIREYSQSKRDHMNVASARRIRLFCVVLMLITTFLGSWLFWAGFVQLAGHSYCPPKLASHAIVWTLASMIGVFFGSGV